MEELPIAFARIGPEAFEPLKSIMEDPKLHPAVRSIAATGLEGIAVLHPDEIDRALDTLREALRRSDSESGQFQTHVIGLITHFRRPEDRELVNGTLGRIPTALDITEEDVDTYFQSSTEPWEWAAYRADPLEFYDDELA